MSTKPKKAHKRKEPAPDQTPAAINRRERLEAIAVICAPSLVRGKPVFAMISPLELQQIYRLAKGT